VIVSGAVACSVLHAHPRGGAGCFLIDRLVAMRRRERGTAQDQRDDCTPAQVIRSTPRKFVVIAVRSEERNASV
jgi:hypothetical protein